MIFKFVFSNRLVPIIPSLFFAISFLILLNQANAQRVGVATSNSFIPINTLDVTNNLTIGSNFSGTYAAPTNSLIVEGNTGIGTTSPQQSLHVYTPNAWNAFLIQGASVGTGIQMALGNNANRYYSWVTSGGNEYFIWDNKNSQFRLKIKSDGNVGVGNTGNPNTLLEVSGDDVYPTCRIIRRNSSNGTPSTVFETFTRYNCLNDEAGNGVPLGVSCGSVANARLGGVYGWPSMGSTNTAVGFYTAQSSSWGCLFAIGGFNWGNPVQHCFSVNHTVLGDVNTASYHYGTANIEVDGTMWCWNSSVCSDKRLKRKIRRNTLVLQKISQTQAISYQINEELAPTMKNHNKTYYGYIAQDLKNIFPYLVVEGAAGYLAVNYNAMIPIVTEALKEQDLQLNNLELRSEKLLRKIEQEYSNISK